MVRCDTQGENELGTRKLLVIGHGNNKRKNQNVKRSGPHTNDRCAQHNDEQQSHVAFEAAFLDQLGHSVFDLNDHRRLLDGGKDDHEERQHPHCGISEASKGIAHIPQAKQDDQHARCNRRHAKRQDVKHDHRDHGDQNDKREYHRSSHSESLLPITFARQFLHSGPLRPGTDPSRFLWGGDSTAPVFH